MSATVSTISTPSFLSTLSYVFGTTATFFDGRCRMLKAASAPAVTSSTAMFLSSFASVSFPDSIPSVLHPQAQLLILRQFLQHLPIHIPNLPLHSLIARSQNSSQLLSGCSMMYRSWDIPREDDAVRNEMSLWMIRWERSWTLESTKCLLGEWCGEMS